jgi:hypothetical protein
MCDANSIWFRNQSRQNWFDQTQLQRQSAIPVYRQSVLVFSYRVEISLCCKSTAIDGRGRLIVLKGMLNKVKALFTSGETLYFCYDEGH